MSHRLGGLRREAERGTLAEVLRELVPLAVDEHTAQVQDALGALAFPAHPGTVEPDTNEVAHGALDGAGAGADVEVVLAQPLVRHAVDVVAQVLERVLQPFATALVARSGARQRAEVLLQRHDHRVHRAVAEAVGLPRDPRTQLGGALGMKTLARAPDLLDDVLPVDARLRFGEVALLQAPDVVEAVGDEQGAFLRALSVEQCFRRSCW